MISVVMPVYNVVKFLREAVESILNQTYRDFEFIIVEGGSTDGTVEIIRSYNDPRVHIEVLPVPGAASVHQWFVRSLNRGIEVASRPLIARMDADDVSLPQRFERQLEVFGEHPDLVLLGTGMDYVTESHAVSRRRHSGAIYWSSRCGTELRVPSIPHGSAMFRRAAAHAVEGYREQFIKAEDQDMWYRLAEQGKAAVLDERLFLYRINRMSILATDRSRGELYALLAADCAKERIVRGSDPLMRGEMLPAVPQADANYMQWHALQRNALVAAIEKRRWTSLWLSLRAGLKRPMARGSWKALLTALGGVR